MFLLMKFNFETCSFLFQSMAKSLSLYGHCESSAKFVDFANCYLARMVGKKLWNFAGTKNSIPIIASKMFRPYTVYIYFKIKINIIIYPSIFYVNNRNLSGT